LANQSGSVWLLGAHRKATRSVSPMQISDSLTARSAHEHVETTILPQLKRSTHSIHSPLELLRIFFSVSRDEK
jgi:hypothetical protein